MGTKGIGNKTQKLSSRATQSEYDEIDEKRKKAHMTISNFIITCCLDKEITIIEGISDLSKELNKVGSNLNQITRLCNQGLISCPDITEMKEVLKKIYQELIKINQKPKSDKTKKSG